MDKEIRISCIGKEELRVPNGLIIATTHNPGSFMVKGDGTNVIQMAC